MYHLNIFKQIHKYYIIIKHWKPWKSCNWGNLKLKVDNMCLLWNALKNTELRSETGN